MEKISMKLMALTFVSLIVIGCFLVLPVKAAITYSNPVVTSNGLVCVATSDGSVYALRASDGLGVWTYNLQASIISMFGIAASNNLVFVSTSDHNVSAINAQTGHLLWTFRAGDAVSYPIAANGKVYFSSSDKYVYALDESTGAVSWSFLLDAKPSTMFNLGLTNGMVCLCDPNGKVYGINALNGHEVWNYIDNEKPGFVRAGNTEFYTVKMVSLPGGMSSNLTSIDSSTGSRMWVYNGTTAVPSGADGMVYSGDTSSNHELYAFDAATGSIAWKTAFSAGFRCLPSNGYVYVSEATTTGAKFHAVNGGNTPLVSGTIAWTFTPTGAPSDPATDGTAVYITAPDGLGGIAYAINAETGNQIWATPLPPTVFVAPEYPAIVALAVVTPFLALACYKIASKRRATPLSFRTLP